MKSNEVNFKMLVPPASVGLLVIVSGICFYLFSSLRKGKPKTDKDDKTVQVDDSRCACCLKPFIIGSGTQCNDCNARFCRKGCGRWETKDNIWLCLFCYHKRTWLKKKEKWFDTFGGLHSEEESSNQFSTAKSQISFAGIENAAVNTSFNFATGNYEDVDSMENIRHTIEKIVESLVGNVDNTPIDRLYEHPLYDRLFEEFGARLARALAHLAIALRMCITNKPAADTPSMAHTALRELVERAVDEARKLPSLGDSVTTRRQDNTSINEHSYEDLLAAAILNKVIEKYQKGRVDGNSNIVHETTSRTCRHKRSEMGVNEANEETSQDECSSECSCTKTKLLRIHQDPLSLTIEEQIEEVTTTYTSDEEPKNLKTNLLHFRNTRRVPFPEYGMDIVDPSQESSGESEDEANGSAPIDRITPLETWEENWLFQKKRIPTQSESVAMLVPNPSEDYRALIGDKDADDMSDLSEFSAQSDDEEVDEDLIEAINRVSPKSPEVEKIPLSLSNGDSVLLDCNFTGEIPRGNHDNLKPQIEHKRVSKKRSGVNEEVKGNVEKIVKDRSESSIPKIKEILEGKNQSECNKTINEHIKENEGINIPKTPASTPIRNSICESDPLLPEICDLRKLNEKLVSIDNEIDEGITHNDKSNSLESGNASEIAKSGECINESVKNEEVRENQHSTPLNEKSFNNVSACQEAAAVARAQSIVSTEAILNDGDLELSAPPRPGSIAEREHKKWENAPPIQNNPYTEENIQKRLLERQYARRSSDVSGSSGILPTSPSPPLQIVIGANRPDVQRFARDYYINESKSSTGEKPRRPGTSSSSRPSSSLSQNSTTASSDFEHQESFEAIEESSKSRNMEEILERERKNSKNEINAKLNNQGNFDSCAIFDGKKPFADDDNRKIRRIDLRAYGFANEFNENDEIKKKPQRVVNKLDLRLFGYDSGLRRTQSNNQIDSKVNNSLIHKKIKDDRIHKSNLTQNSARLRQDDYDWTQSTEDLNRGGEIIFDKFGGMKSAKSVPNIAKSSSYTYNTNKIISDSEEDVESHITPIIKGRDNGERCNSTNGTDSYDSDTQNSRTESTEELPRKFTTLKELKYSLEALEGPDRFIDKQLPMPSVRRLAQAFNTPTEVKLTATLKSNKNPQNSRDRPTTPEIHLIKTPRQMHSLTARSLSREFREGLRQISCKPNAQPVYSTILEQSKVPTGTVISSELENTDNSSIIAPGNLKNNIKFWEQLQKKN